MNLTPEEFAVLAHVVIDPQAWADHAEATVGAQAVIDKVARWRPDYLEKKDLPGYKTKAEIMLATNIKHGL